MSETEKFLIITTRHKGWNGAVLFWGPERRGYTTRLGDAGRYSKDEAVELSGSGDFAIPESALSGREYSIIDRDAHEKELLKLSREMQVQP
jgi:hypothetical protein